MTKYRNTMTPEEIEAWTRSPGRTGGGGKQTMLERLEAKAATDARPRTPTKPPKPPRTCLDCGDPISERALRCATCSLKARTAPGRTPVVLVAMPSHIPEFVKTPAPPCRFCGEPSTDEDRCARHDAVWRRLQGLPPAELERLAE